MPVDYQIIGFLLDAIEEEEAVRVLRIARNGQEIVGAYTSTTVIKVLSDGYVGTSPATLLIVETDTTRCLIGEVIVDRSERMRIPESTHVCDHIYSDTTGPYSFSMISSDL